MTNAPLPAKKKTSSLTILLAIIGGGLVVLGLLGAVAAYFILSSPDARAVVGAVGDAVKVAAKAQKAPGTKELRAMGCKEALVMDRADLSKMKARFGDDADDDERPFGEMVVCSVSPWGDAVSCERVANTYVGAVGQRAEPFFVTVQQGRKGAGDCTFLYDGAGNELGRFDEHGAPDLPFVE